jgi:hypothetical protein
MIFPHLLSGIICFYKIPITLLMMIFLFFCLFWFEGSGVVVKC